MRDSRCLVFDDGPAHDEHGEDAVLIWNSYAAESPAESVPAYLERHGDRLRARYLAFIHDLGESVVAGRKLVDHFRQSDGFSFWWMNRVAEKSPFKSTRVFDCLRLLALEEMLAARAAKQVTLHSADRELAAALGRLCANTGVSFEWRRSERHPGDQAVSVRSAYDALPHWLQGLLSFRHLALRWSFRSLRAVERARGPRALFFASYLFNLDDAAAASGEFHSRQWEALPAWLRDRGVRTNWLHQFLPDGGRDISSSVAMLRTFNKDAARQGTHAVLETYLSASTVWAIVRAWLWHVGLGWRLRGVSECFTPRDSKAWLWPLLADDWRISLGGTAAVTNCACRVLFDAAVSDLPPQPMGLYLLEGQGWETAFVHAWRKHGHGEVVGVPHSSMPFWYLSIYDDRRHYGEGNQKPLPDRWALNGKHAASELIAAGLPPERVAGVEALRFQHLTATTKRTERAAERAGRPTRLLLLGDFTRAQTLRMIRCLQDALPAVTHSLQIAIKRHPVCPLDASDVGAMPCEFIEHPLGDVLGRFDIAFASNTTSAGLDALLAGLPVIAFLDDAGFNQSPLRGVAHARFVSTPAGLSSAINTLRGERVDTPVEDFFWIDPNLPRWSSLVSRVLGVPAIEMTSA
jgi:surface carbohydrate biosynthesis protein (TIGR04326 family)